MTTAAPVISFTTPAVQPARLELSTLPSEGKSKFEQAWDILVNDKSWHDLSERDAFKNRHGLEDSEGLEFLGPEEIEELSELLTTVPLRKFNKIMNG